MSYLTDNDYHIKTKCCKIYTCHKCKEKVAGHVAWWANNKPHHYVHLPAKRKKEIEETQEKL
jgi:hypothetical protein